MLSSGLRDNAQQWPQQLAVVHGPHRLTYVELEASANRLAHVFRSRGLVRGDHVACLLHNGVEIFSVVWAAYRCGLYLTPVPSTLAPREAAYIVNNCEARLVIAHASMQTLVESLLAQCNVVRNWFSVCGVLDGFEALEPLLCLTSDQPIEDEAPGALMLYTSGTTGAPKGVWRPLLPADYTGPPLFARDLLELYELGGTDVRYLSTAPLYHSAPLRMSLAITAGGGTVFVMERFDAETALRMIESENITHSQWVPVMFQRLLALPRARRDAHSAPKHRMAIFGAAPCPHPVRRSMIEWWGAILIEYYAGTEGVGGTTISSQEWLERPGSVGSARRGAIHILGDDDVELPAGQTGRIFFSGLSAFTYFNDPGKTSSRVSAQGYQTLGDIGHVDQDGYLYLTDRADDMIISGGVNIYPQEIEAAILEVAGVADCCVVGIPDEKFGETPIAFVVLTPQAAAQTEVALNAIVESNKARLGRLKQPSAINFCAELPRSPTGKLLRRQMLVHQRDGATTEYKCS
ncbi:MAG: AMP-binding protein [Burkholderiaceae bacterium]|nr:AMP-binding protein [Burkholderiaceae bacterium]